MIDRLIKTEDGFQVNGCKVAVLDSRMSRTPDNGEFPWSVDLQVPAGCVMSDGRGVRIGSVPLHSVSSVEIEINRQTAWLRWDSGSAEVFWSQPA
jgi:hypothetical protein